MVSEIVFLRWVYYHGNRHMTLLVYTLDNFLIKQRLGTKEQQNVLKFVMETSQVRSKILV